MKAFLRANWDRALGALLVLAGVVALIAGWVGISGTGLAAEQNPYLISGGLGGLGLIGIGCTLWLSADLQDEWRRLDALEERLRALEETASRVVNPPESGGPASNGMSSRRRRSERPVGSRP